MAVPTQRICIVHHEAAVQACRVRTRLETTYFARCLKATLENADVIFTDSDFANGQIRDFAMRRGIRPRSVITAGIGFSHDEKAPPAKKDAILLLTSAWPHKLTLMAIDFLRRWQMDTGYKGLIQLAGGLPAGASLPEDAGWKLCARLSEKEYREKMAESRMLLFFSEYEGFGMPPVEAAIAGTCPVYSDIQVSREVMSGAGYAFLNGSYISFSSAMDAAMSVSEETLSSWAVRLLERHDWNAVTDKVVNGLSTSCK
jgi:glycosyltransferase involved in cell wall biosynthesis